LAALCYRLARDRSKRRGVKKERARSPEAAAPVLLDG